MPRSSLADFTTGIRCSHCGDDCADSAHSLGKESFCCQGCQMVYTMLHDSGMSDYYRYGAQPGISQRSRTSRSYEYLDNDEIIARLRSFSDGGITKVTFRIPQIHCSSCLWLLEHLNELDRGVTKSVVNFSTKKATITYREEETSLRRVVEMLVRIGYEPELNYDQLDNKKANLSYDKQLILKLGVAGFCFGNIMLLSFPEYLGFEKASYLFHIGYINIVLAIPVFLYSGSEYLRSAYNGLRRRSVNIDLPIALGMVALFGRSLYEILGHCGEGYLDSFAGFIFFLLIGRWFQSITYRSLDFDRSYKSYFPISANVREGNRWISKSLDQINPGDRMRIRNQELIPADGILQQGNARIDYSFVTGEADLISKEVGEVLFAGGRQQGQSIELVVTKSVDHSYLTQLWSEEAFHNGETSTSGNLISLISKYFTFSILAIALCTMIFWLTRDPAIAFSTFTSVLIVACPCALALALPFTYGHVLRMLSRDGLYLRNVQTIEQIQNIDYVIFDKTGTITDSRKIEVFYHGKPLTNKQRVIIKSACSHSSHPLSMAIVWDMCDVDIVDVAKYQDVIGSGFIAECLKSCIKLGSSAFLFGTVASSHDSGVFIEINGEYVGNFEFRHALRAGCKEVMSSLSARYQVAVLSGDTNHDDLRIRTVIGEKTKAYYNQSPKDKLNRIRSLQQDGKRVMMIGDGLNDAGALKQADVGIAISDETNNFSPACDGILDAKYFCTLSDRLCFVTHARLIIYGAFILAFLYNCIGLYFAVRGELSPVIAAILMPLSSITVIIYGVVGSWALYQKSKAW